MRQVFVILTGAYGNVGDGVIRRRVFEWVRDAGAVHAYVGGAPDDWIEQLGLRPDERVYRGKQARTWMNRLLFSRGKRALVFDPGQVPLGRRALRSEIVYLLITIWTRLRGGIVIRPPRAFAGQTNRVTLEIHRLACRASNLTLWRTPRSLARMRVGQFCPDTAFQEPLREGKPWRDRSITIVSMRGKRTFPSPEWFAALERFTARTGGRVVLASQVREDEERTRDLAHDLRGRGLDVTYEPWGTRTDLEQEVFTRELYEQAKFVVSDRLHVLILAAKGGALPLELTDQHPSKAEEHFAAIGYEAVSFLTGRGSGSIDAFIDTTLSRLPELQSRMSEAQRAVDRYRDAISGRVADL